MRITKEQIKIADSIGWELRDGDFAHVPLKDGAGDQYAGWFAALLSTLTVIISASEITYSQTDYSMEDGTVRFLIVTPELLVVTDVKGLSGEEPQYTTQIVGRKTLTALVPSVSMRVDEKSSRAYGWPGFVEIAATYEGLDRPVVYRHEAYQTGADDEPSPILNLLAALQVDLIA